MDGERLGDGSGAKTDHFDRPLRYRRGRGREDEELARPMSKKVAPLL